MQDHCPRETRKTANLGSSWAAWIFTWPSMHHYWCQNVYISTTANECIMDTIGFFPRNYQIPQLSSTDRLLMAAKDTKDALQNPHPTVPFTSVGDDTIKALVDLAEIFKLKLQQASSPVTQTLPPKVVSLPSPATPSNQILNSPMPIRRQTRSQTTIHTQLIPNAPLPPRVVTPRTLRQSTPRVPNGSRIPSPRSLSQDEFCEMDSDHMAITLGTKHWSQRQHASAGHPPSNQIRNGILGSHERSPSTTASDARFWQQMRTPIPGNSRHSRNRYTFLHRSEKHHK
jgi:hypothetical protein